MKIMEMTKAGMILICSSISYLSNFRKFLDMLYLVDLKDYRSNADVPLHKINTNICMTMCYGAVMLKLVTYYLDLKICKIFQSFFFICMQLYMNWHVTLLS